MLRSALAPVSTSLTLLGALLALVGCGDNNPAPDAPTPTPDAPVASDVPETGDPTIAEIAAGNPDFSILVAAAGRAGLVDELSNPDVEFTVFAPTDDAFEASGITLAMIEAMPETQVAGILTYHALIGRILAADIDAGPATTVASLTLFLGTTGGVTINGGNAITGGANVVMADIEASNGVIHIIDRVLLPPNIPMLATYGGLTSLVGAVTSAGLADDLSAAGPFTVFAPTNDAFAALGTAPTGDALVQVLLYHVVSGAVVSTAVPARADSLATNEWSNNLTLLFNTSSGVVVNGGATVVAADLRATNGVVHVVDEVILPMNVVDAATAAGLDGLLGAVGDASPLPGGTTVAAALAADAPYTVFAPTNAAFDAVAAVVATLTADQLRDVLLFHVLDTTDFPAPVLSTDLPAAAANLGTLNAANDIAYLPGPPPTFEGADIVSGLVDINVTNGVVHVIDAVMVP
jgi:transforming growth factor-beta-induced protein